jgi:hypothetical protein
VSLIARDTRPALPVRRDEAIEPARLRRGAQLAVQRISATRYMVRGSKGTVYPVDLMGDPVCYCEDSLRRGGLCKHGHSAALASGDMRFINALAATYEAAVRAEREAAEARAARKAARTAKRTSRRARTATVAG